MRRKKGKANNQTRPHWYYDACTLDRSKGFYGEMFNKHHPIQVTISHLAFGEAYANSFGKGPEQVDAFVRLMQSLRPFIKITEHDGCEKVLVRVRDTFNRLSITDAIHLATAIRYGCVIFRTIDSDLYKLERKRVTKLAREFGLSSFSITKME